MAVFVIFIPGDNKVNLFLHKWGYLLQDKLVQDVKEYYDSLSASGSDFAA